MIHKTLSRAFHHNKPLFFAVAFLMVSITSLAFNVANYSVSYAWCENRIDGSSERNHDCLIDMYDEMGSEDLAEGYTFDQYNADIDTCMGGNADGTSGSPDDRSECANAVLTCRRHSVDISKCSNGDVTASIAEWCNDGKRGSAGSDDCDRLKSENEDSYGKLRDSYKDKAREHCSTAQTQRDRENCAKAIEDACNIPGLQDDGTPSGTSAVAERRRLNSCYAEALMNTATTKEDCEGRGGKWQANKCEPGDIECKNAAGDTKTVKLGEECPAGYTPSDPNNNPLGGDPNSGDPDAGGEEVTCAVDGVGWIVCPISNFLAKIADTAYNLIEGFLGYNMMSDAAAKDKLQKQWSVFANLANVAFVIVFLIVIFSQVSGWGMDNYSLKRMMPRLIVGAILVNASFWICAIAVDMSNVLGTNLKELLTQSAGSGANNGTWESVMSSILTGTAVVGTAIVIGAVGAALSGGFFALLGLALPVLIGALVAIFTVFLILVARQALITILIVLAPLAFVANLLPNTEQWYKRWQKAFMGVLVVFPAIAILFGGAQLAAGILMSAGGITMNIFALGVQAAPLFLVLTVLKKLMQVDGIAGMSQRFGGKLGGALGKKGQEAANRRQAKFNANHMAPSNHSRWDPRRYAGGAARRAKQHAWEDGITEQRANEAFRSSNSERLRNDPEYRMRMAGNNEDTANLLRAQAEQQGVEEATKHKQAFQTRYDDMSSDAIMSELGLTIDNDGNIDGMEQALERNGAQVAAAVAALGKRGFDNNGHLAGISNAVIAHAEGSSMARGAVAESMTNLGVMGAGAANAMRMEGPGGDNLDRRLAASAAGMSEENIAKLRGSEFAAVANAAQQTGNFDAMTNLVDKSERLINPDHRLHGQIKEGTIQEMERLGIRRP